MSVHKAAFDNLRAPPLGFVAKYMSSWHAEKDQNTGEFKAFQTETCAAPSRADARAFTRTPIGMDLRSSRPRCATANTDGCVSVTHSIAHSTPAGARSVRKLLNVDFKARLAAKGIVEPGAFNWNLGSLSYFFMFTQARLTCKKGPGGMDTYGNLKDGNDALMEIESIQAWLLEPVVMS